MRTLCGSLFLAIVVGFGALPGARGDAFLDAIDAIIAAHVGTGADPMAVEDAAWAVGFIYSDIELILATGYDSYTLNPQFNGWLQTAVAAFTDPVHDGMLTPEGIVALLNEVGVAATREELQTRLAILRQILEDNPEAAAEVNAEALGEILETLDATALLLGGGAMGDREDELRQAMGGFSPFSAPIQLSRNLLSRNLLRGLSASPTGGGESRWLGSESAFWGIDTWGESWEAAGEDGLSLATLPYYQGGCGATSFAVGLPLFWTTIDDMASDTFWAVGLDGMVRQDLGGGFFVGGHAAVISNYAEMLEDNQYFSAAAGPFAGVSWPISERFVVTGAVLTEGVYTEHTSSTWYVAAGAGLSVLPVDNVALHLYGLYYRNMDTYNAGEDNDFFDVGATVEVFMGERTSVTLGGGTIFEADGYDSFTANLGFKRAF
jgi:hypothetical protein